ADHLGWHAEQRRRSSLGLCIENGRIRDDGDRRLRSAIRRVVETLGAGVRLTPQQNLLITDVPDRCRGLVERILADHGVTADAMLSPVRRWSMACPALPTCGLALAEAERALPDVISELERELETLGVADAALTVRMTGCPNGCARPYTADLAFVGRSLNKYAVFVGGSMLGTRLGTQYADPVRRNAIEHKRRPYRRGDLKGAWLAIAATDDRGTNGAVWAEAEQLGVPLNAVDDLEHCSFIAPAVHREGDITVAVSTAGKSPALAVPLRQRLARLVGRAEARLCELLGELRPGLAERVPD